MVPEGISLQERMRPADEMLASMMPSSMMPPMQQRMTTMKKKGGNMIINEALCTVLCDNATNVVL